MSLSRSVRRLVLGEHGCRVLIEVSDLGPDGWRRLTADTTLRWRRLGAPLRSSGSAALRRRRGKVEPLARPDLAAPVPALLEATGAMPGTASVAQRRLAMVAASRLRAAGLLGEVLGAAPAGASPPAPVVEDVVWPASGGVLIFGPADQDELDRRFGVVSSAWSDQLDPARRPVVPEPGRRPDGARIDAAVAVCVLPLLLMVVPTVGPWLNTRRWVLLFAAAVVCLALPLLVVHHFARRPFFAKVRVRALVVSAGLIAALVLARVLAAIPVPPLLVLVVALLVLAVATPVAVRTVPSGTRGLLVVVAAVSALLCAPVGEVLDGVYLARLDLRVTDISVTFVQRWLSGALFAVCLLAGLAVALAGWGLVHRLDAVGRERPAPPTPVLAVLGLVYAAGVLALCAGVARDRAGADSDGMPGSWGGISTSWVCWSPATTPTNPAAVPAFAGRALPPTGTAVAWLGGADGRYALWSPSGGGVTVPDQVRLLSRDAAGPCPR